MNINLTEAHVGCERCQFCNDRKEQLIMYERNMIVDFFTSEYPTMPTNLNHRKCLTQILGETYKKEIQKLKIKVELIEHLKEIYENERNNEK